MTLGSAGRDGIVDCSVPLPVSNIQNYLWEKIERGEHSPWAMNIALSIGLKGKIDKSALRAAVNDLIGNAEILRTNFAYCDGIRSQIVRRKASFCLEVKDYRRAGQDRRERWMLASKEALSLCEFDIEKDLLIRGCLFSLSDETATVFFVIHHLIFDGYSRRPFTETLLAAYNSKMGRSALPLPPPAQYAHFTAWERALPISLMNTNTNYWTKQFAGFLPTRDTEDKGSSGNCAAVRFTISRHFRDSIQRVARSNNCSLFVGLLAIFIGFMLKKKNSDDLCVWTPCVQREMAEFATAIGPLYTNLPLRIRGKADSSLNDLMGQIRNSVLEAMEHQWIGSDALAKIAGRRQILCFNYTDINQISQTASDAEAAVGDFEIVRERSKRVERHPSELVLAMENGSNGLRAAFSYRTSDYGKTRAEVFAAEFCRLARRWIAAPDVSLVKIYGSRT